MQTHMKKEVWPHRLTADRSNHSVMPTLPVQLIKKMRNITSVFVAMASKEMVLFVKVIRNNYGPIIIRPLYVNLSC